VKIEFKTKDAEFVDPKHYSTLMENAFECLKSSVSLKKITYIKIVVSSKTDLSSFKELIKRIFEIISKTDIAGFIIQPTYGVAEPSLEQLLEFYDTVYPLYSEVRIIPQLHKLIGAP
jgi:organic radical activating enzyme